MNKTSTSRPSPDDGHPSDTTAEEPTDSVAGEEDPGAAMDTTGVPQPVSPRQPSREADPTLTKDKPASP